LQHLEQVESGRSVEQKWVIANIALKNSERENPCFD